MAAWRQQADSTVQFLQTLNLCEEAVQLYRDRARAHQERHRELEAEDDWDDDHRYSEAYLLKRRREELKGKEVRRAEQDLHDASLTLSACLQQLDHVDEAAAGTEAATLPD
jgi:hypothetical protein